MVFEEWAAVPNTDICVLAKTDLLQYSLNGALCIGFCLGFARATNNFFAAIASPCERLAETTWQRHTHALIHGVAIGAIVGSLPFYAYSVLIRVCINPDSQTTMHQHALSYLLVSFISVHHFPYLL